MTSPAALASAGIARLRRIGAGRRDRSRAEGRAPARRLRSASALLRRSGIDAAGSPSRAPAAARSTRARRRGTPAMFRFGTISERAASLTTRPSRAGLAGRGQLRPACLRCGARGSGAAAPARPASPSRLDLGAPGEEDGAGHERAQRRRLRERRDAGRLAGGEARNHDGRERAARAEQRRAQLGEMEPGLASRRRPAGHGPGRQLREERERRFVELDRIEQGVRARRECRRSPPRSRRRRSAMPIPRQATVVVDLPEPPGPASSRPRSPSQTTAACARLADEGASSQFRRVRSGNDCSQSGSREASSVQMAARRRARSKTCQVRVSSSSLT